MWGGFLVLGICLINVPRTLGPWGISSRTVYRIPAHHSTGQKREQFKDGRAHQTLRPTFCPEPVVLRGGHSTTERRGWTMGSGIRRWVCHGKPESRMDHRQSLSPGVWCPPIPAAPSARRQERACQGCVLLETIFHADSLSS